MASYNKTLGRFELVGLPPAPRGVPQIEVTFDIDANGIVHVSAKDMATGKEQSIRITASSGLSKEEIDGMIKDAQTHAEEDKKRKELVEVRNEADTIIYSIEKSLSEFGEKISESEKSTIQGNISEMRKAMEGEDVEAIRTKIQELNKASHKFAEEMYKQTSKGQTGPEAGAQPSGQETPEAGKPNENVVDADFEEVDKDKK